MAFSQDVQFFLKVIETKDDEKGMKKKTNQELTRRVLFEDMWQYSKREKIVCVC